jgi:N-acetylmuramoyl-L-alanine amidase
MSSFAPDFPAAVVRASPNFGERRESRLPDMILLHYTGMATGEGAEDWLCNPAAEVSAHYLLHEDGRIVQMVREADRAWHAGKSFWRGETDINSCSIGIEIANPGPLGGFPDFPSVQIEAVIALCRDILARNAIRPARVLAHSDVAPGRKIDPGEKFPWPALHAAGVGHLVPAAPVQPGSVLRRGEEGEGVSVVQSLLADVGYGIAMTGVFDADTEATIAAFQRHFRPALVDGVADRSTQATLKALVTSFDREGRIAKKSKRVAF